jgi:hypothetical protein
MYGDKWNLILLNRDRDNQHAPFPPKNAPSNKTQAIAINAQVDNVCGMWRGKARAISDGGNTWNHSLELTIRHVKRRRSRHGGARHHELHPTFVGLRMANYDGGASCDGTTKRQFPKLE